MKLPREKRVDILVSFRETLYFHFRPTNYEIYLKKKQQQKQTNKNLSPKRQSVTVEVLSQGPF